MSMPDFKKWPSIMRLSSEVCYITEKIDGTNAVIHVADDGIVLAGSRERWLSNDDGTPPEKNKDNFGFGQWVYERRSDLVKLGPGTHYGEFHGKGIQRQYGLADRRFASFEYWRNDIAIDGVCVVPILLTCEPIGDPWDAVVETLKRNGSALYHGFMNPEGVVITFKEMKSAKFKRLCDKDRLHKYQQVAK